MKNFKKAELTSCPAALTAISPVVFSQAYPSGSSESILTGTKYIRVTVPDDSDYSVSEVIFKHTNNLLVSRAQQVYDSGSLTIWEGVFETKLRSSQDGNFGIYPQFSVNVTGVSGKCDGATQYFTFSHTTPTDLTAEIHYGTTAYTGITMAAGSSKNFSAWSNFTLYDINPVVYEYGLIAWQSEYSGTISYNISSPWQISYTAPTSGTDILRLKIQYAGKDFLTQMGIQIEQQTVINPTPTPSTATSSASATSTTSSLTTSPTPTPTTKPVKSTADKPKAAPYLANRDLSDKEKECISDAIGSKRLNEIIKAGSAPSLAEIERIKTCFASVNHILPVAIVPIKEQVLVEQLATDKETKIASLNNDTKTGLDVSYQTMVISGKSAPFSTVFIYIFSEPLVMTTTADKDGNWTYELENPLEPGEHEIYAVVDSGDGVYKKSDPFSFVIGRAEASAENPEGYSLKLESVSPPSVRSNILIYVFIVSLVVMLALVILYWYVAKKRKLVLDDSRPAVDSR